ncbi:MAG TPA: 2-methylcitrate dehydratase, partial [Alphaproteobacteria bacterium]|nr:2-methylcitrate dehydratase [Alphaproteobacteria bacterium]
MTVTDTLVEFITAGLPPEPDVLRIVDLCLLDWASVTCAGKDEPVSQLVRNRAMAEGGTAEAQVCGASQRLPARTSAMVNGVTSHALDYDDTHFA